MKNILFAVLWFVLFGGIFGFILAFLSKKLAVSEDARKEKLLSLLPGANCGGCGYAGCSAFAEALLAGKEKPNHCASCNAKEIKELCALLGVEEEAPVRRRAVVRCSGGALAKDKYLYEGIRDCRIAAKLAGGNKACENGCTGLGNCKRACVFGAIELVDGRAEVNEKLCRGCGACVEACPKKIIELVPFDAKFAVCCASAEKAKLTMQVCEAGCIGCKKCVRSCPSGAISVQEALAVIDYEKCTRCGICFEVCPRKIIRKWENI